MLSFKAYLAEKKSKVLINPKKDDLKEKKNHGEDCDCMKCEEKRRKEDVNDGPDTAKVEEYIPEAPVVGAIAKGAAVAAKGAAKAGKLAKAAKVAKKAGKVAVAGSEIAANVSTIANNNSSSTTYEAVNYTGPDKKDRKLIKKMDNPSYLKKFKDYEKNMDPKKRQALKDKATKGMKKDFKGMANKMSAFGNQAGSKMSAFGSSIKGKAQGMLQESLVVGGYQIRVQKLLADAPSVLLRPGRHEKDRRG